MQPGERQVAPTRDGIRRDHVARYEWAASMLPNSGTVIDVGCGIGYGTQILAERGLTAWGIDADAEAVEYARAHYAHDLASFSKADVALGVYKAESDFAVCFEVIEHLADPLEMLKALRHDCHLLMASVPNEAVFPHQGRVKYHHRHYTRAQFEQLLNRAGWRVKSWWGQKGPESEVELEVEGRTLIAVAVRGEEIAAVSLKVTRPEQVPEHVAIVGLGPSCATFFELVRREGGASAYCDEVWGINAHGDVLRCDRVFHMDDLRIQEARAAARPDSNIAAMVRWLKKHPGPVYTSIVREGYPGLVAFPLQDVLNGCYDSNGGAPYFNSTAAYAIAYAVHIGVKRISLFGLDYTLPNANNAEKGRGCCEFWLGIAAARGIEITIPDTSSLMDACEPPEARLYGYDCVDITLHDVEGGVMVKMAEREVIPTADEIEHRYDHTRHPNTLVENERKAQHG